MHRQKGEQAPTPVTLRYGDDYYYDYTHDTYNTYDGDIYYSEEDYEKSEHPIRYGIEQNLKDAVIRYGYDPETVNAWFESESVQWSDLMEAQKAAQQELAIAEVHAVNEYVKGILDNAMKDVRNNQQQWQAEFVATLEEKVADFHTDLDNYANSVIGMIEEGIEETYESVKNLTVDNIAFAQVQPVEESSHSALIGFGILGALGLAAYATHLNKQKSIVNKETRQHLIDEEFVMV